MVSKQQNQKARSRVLILSASAGTGHLRAAEALQKVCVNHSGVLSSLHLDALNYTNKLFRDFYSKFYIKLVQDAPTILGWWYQTSDEPWKTDKMRLMLDRLNTGPLVSLIKKIQPDITICTHFLPAEIISHLITQGSIQTRLSIVVTDFDFHAMWLSRVFHHYFVALDETKAHLTMLGLPQQRITVSGIPIDPVFNRMVDSIEMRRKHGLRLDLPVLLLSAGALGVGPTEHVVRILQQHLKTPAQIVVICGQNEELRTRVLEQIAQFPVSHLYFQVEGFTTVIDEWMAAATLFIGKPGGLTAAEAMARHLPFVIFSPIPGQEERNSDHLLEKGCAIKCNDITTMPYKIDLLLQDSARLQQMREASARLAKPKAAETVVQTLLNLNYPHPVLVPEEHQEQMVELTRKR